MTKKGKALLLTFFFLVGLKALKAQDSMMDDISYVYMEKLVAVAIENYPRIKIGEARLKIAQAGISKAKIGWLNPVSLSYVHSPQNNLNILNPTFFSGYQLGLFFNIGAVLITPYNVKQAKQELEVTKYDNAEYILTLSTEVKRRYILYIRSKKMVQVASKILVSSQADAALMKYRFERGESTMAEYNNAQDRVNTQTSTKIQSEGEMLSAKASLEELLGVKLEDVK